jgi:Fe-S-cluster containining protein
MIADVDRRCRRIVSRHPEQIACTKGCAGNCCRIHLTVYPVEAVALARALQAKPPEMQRRIRQQARHTNTFGPCPLLADGACQLYAARAVICRTHGLPVRTEYRGHRSIGFCQKKLPVFIRHSCRRHHRSGSIEQQARRRQPSVCQSNGPPTAARRQIHYRNGPADGGVIVFFLKILFDHQLRFLIPEQQPLLEPI